MLGAFTAWMLLTYLGIGYWGSLLLAPIIVGAAGIVLERLFIRRLYHLDHLYGLLLTFGLALLITGIFTQLFGVSGIPYPSPPLLAGAHHLAYLYLPNSRDWVIIPSVFVCFRTRFL